MKPARRLYYVYVVELALIERSVYVGQSADRPEVRFDKHVRGGPSTSRHVRHHGRRLRPDLYEHLNPLRSRDAARKAEKALRRDLESRGFRVYGPCVRSRGTCRLEPGDRRSKP